MRSTDDFNITCPHSSKSMDDLVVIRNLMANEMFRCCRIRASGEKVVKDSVAGRDACIIETYLRSLGYTHF